MITLGPISSIFDIATFVIMLRVFKAGEALFRTGWFVESLATQTLVIFVIRTAASPWALPPSRGLALGVAGSVGVAVLLPFTPLAPWLGFVPLPPAFFGFLVVMTAVYLAAADVAKRWLYRTAGL
jgi:P-type Mg2+ transporter